MTNSARQRQSTLACCHVERNGTSTERHLRDFAEYKWSEIAPVRIELANERFFFRARPLLDLCLANDCVANLVELLIVEQLSTAILVGEAVRHGVPMFAHASRQAVRHADVEHAVVHASDYVDPKRVIPRSEERRVGKE